MYDTLLRHPFMSDEGRAATQAQDLVAAMCAVEVALATEQEVLGILPAGAAAEIERVLAEHAFDMDAMAHGTVLGGNAAIPFVKQAKAALPDELKAHFHRGATSQDILDTALMLLLKPRLEACLALMKRSRMAGCALMRRHADTPMVGRTLMQQALPITFGVKVAQWAENLAQAERRLRDVTETGLYLQFGGAVGVHSGLDAQGLEVMDRVAERLGLASPLLPWHTNRQPILALSGAVDAVAVGVEKVALDVSLLTQSEVAEVSEPAVPGAGGSSSMPHKRNPVICARLRAAARQIHGQAATLSHAGAQPLERGLGEWHAEWAPMLDAVLLMEGALASLAELWEGLDVHAETMRHNLTLMGGAIMAEPAARLLGDILGADEAQRIAREAAETSRLERREYAEVLLAHPAVAGRVEAQRLRRCVDPGLYIGSSQGQVQRALAALVLM